jgi:uncharacterized repeat protein (TIGR03803 family)
MKRNFCSLSNLNGIRMGAVFVICAATAIALSAQTPDTDETDALTVPTFTTLYTFSGPDGSDPPAGLVQGPDGNLYGTTNDGGTTNEGTIFKITPNGALTTLHNFCVPSAPSCTDGWIPNGPLVLADNGLHFYGTTLTGGGGTVFKITPSGTLITLHFFCCTDGKQPLGGLVQSLNGDLYGVTYLGATNPGTVFQITPAGTLTTLYNFCTQDSCLDGEYPQSPLVQAANGSLYGTNAGTDGYGAIFKLDGYQLTIVYRFCAQDNCADGRYPKGPLVQAANGDLYGTTTGGGKYDSGTVFKITPSGTLTTLHSFCAEGGCPDGVGPGVGLIQATDGNMYGTTVGGGANTQGTIFKITPNGRLTTLYSFCSQSGCPDGSGPSAGLVQATNGDFYGTTTPVYPWQPCAPNCGTVFRLSVGLGPFVRTLPTERRVGKDVKILGTDLTAATSVTFNGVPATFTVVSSTEIDTTVPVGATSGKVEVFLPSGNLSSNVRFRVLP